jgi:hypothetical protein
MVGAKVMLIRLKRVASKRVQATRFDACRFPETAALFWATCIAAKIVEN